MGLCLGLKTIDDDKELKTKQLEHVWRIPGQPWAPWHARSFKEYRKLAIKNTNFEISYFWLVLGFSNPSENAQWVENSL